MWTVYLPPTRLWAGAPVETWFMGKIRCWSTLGVDPAIGGLNKLVLNQELVAR